MEADFKVYHKRISERLYKDAFYETIIVKAMGRAFCDAYFDHFFMYPDNTKEALVKIGEKAAERLIRDFVSDNPFD